MLFDAAPRVTQFAAVDGFVPGPADYEVLPQSPRTKSKVKTTFSTTKRGNPRDTYGDAGAYGLYGPGPAAHSASLHTIETKLKPKSHPLRDRDTQDYLGKSQEPKNFNNPVLSTIPRAIRWEPVLPSEDPGPYISHQPGLLGPKNAAIMGSAARLTMTEFLAAAGMSDKHAAPGPGAYTPTAPSESERRVLSMHHKAAKAATKPLPAKPDVAISTPGPADYQQIVKPPSAHQLHRSFGTAARPSFLEACVAAAEIPDPSATVGVGQYSPYTDTTLNKRSFNTRARPKRSHNNGSQLSARRSSVKSTASAPSVLTVDATQWLHRSGPSLSQFTQSVLPDYPPNTASSTLRSTARSAILTPSSSPPAVSPVATPARQPGQRQAQGQADIYVPPYARLDQPSSGASTQPTMLDDDMPPLKPIGNRSVPSLNSASQVYEDDFE